MSTAVVVGSGPNGLAAAVHLARAGVRVTVLEAAPTIGGGTRSARLQVGDGANEDVSVITDVCSAVHPLGVASPFFRSLRLERHGLRWRWSDIELGHPLEGGSTALLYRDIERTAEGLGTDGDAWRRTFGPMLDHWDDVLEGILGPLIRLHRHPVSMARFGVSALRSATGLAERWSDDPARALFAGSAAHAFRRLDQPLSASVGLVLTTAAHARGWPVAEGGSQAIAEALVAELVEHGGSIRTENPVEPGATLPEADLVLLDLAPGAAADLLASRQPSRVARSYRRFRHGPGAHKVDYAIRGDIPWLDPELARCGTVHLGGTLEQLTESEASVLAGRVPDRPFVLVAQQYVADPTRSADGINPIWAYAHVPGGSSEDHTALVTEQIERFAPGFADRIVASASKTATDLAASNANYVGGDIGGGATAGRQLLVRPRAAVDPYRTGVDGVFLCSASTPPGAGVHGMSGYFAAVSALSSLRN